MLAAWADSPARFREDANAEEDLALGGYRDRLLVELAQNAADAAVRGGVVGRVRIRLADGVLSVANTGTPLDADGVQALATLRASAKRTGGTAGRFGVGFAAVLAACDEPEVRSSTGSIAFSAARTRALVDEIPALAEELARRGGAVPVLRLPFGIEAAPPAGFATEVRLALRPGAEPVVRRQLADLAADVLLALPALAEVDIDGRLLTRVERPDGDIELHDGTTTRCWRVVVAEGEFPVEVLADRPVEERERSAWAVRWAVPLREGRVDPLVGRQVVHAPTPSDEPLSLPVRLIASYPLDPDRRHVAPGRSTDYVTARAAAAYGELVRSFGTDPAVLALVPSPVLVGGQLDAALGAAATRVLSTVAWLPAVEGRPVPTDRAAVVDAGGEDLVKALREIVPGLLPAAWGATTYRRALDVIGVRRWGVGDVVELLGGVQRPALWWHRLYAALGDWGLRADADALASLPVPLADGRTAFGPRGLLLAEPGLDTSELTGLRLRLVAGGAAHPLLERLGARSATARALLLDPDVQAAVAASLDEEEPEPVVAAVLALVAAAGVDTAEHPWLAELALPDADGGWSSAGELVLPGSPFAAVIDPEALGTVDEDALRRWGPERLTAVGVLADFAVLAAGDLEVGDELDLEDAQGWYDAVLDRLPDSRVPPRLLGVRGVRDLELVRPDRWAAALRLLDRLPAAVFAPVPVQLPDGSTRTVPSYTSWWLSTRPVLDGVRPDRLRRNGSTELSGVYDEAPAATPGYLACVETLDDVLADPDAVADLLDRLGDPDRAAPPAVCTTGYARIALAAADVAPPHRIRTVDGQVVEPDAAAVLDAPHVLPLLDRAAVGGGGRPLEVADLLDLPLASELVAGQVDDATGVPGPWAQVPGAGLAAVRLGVPTLTGTVCRHERLIVDGRTVPWWPATAVDHVDRSPGAMGRALAWRHGVWSRRAELAEAFAFPDAAASLAAEDAVDQPDRMDPR